MTQIQLRAIRHNPEIRVFAELHAFRRPVAHWVRGEDGKPHCVWESESTLRTAPEISSILSGWSMR